MSETSSSETSSPLLKSISPVQAAEHSSLVSVYNNARVGTTGWVKPLERQTLEAFQEDYNAAEAWVAEGKIAELRPYRENASGHHYVADFSFRKLK